jgi:branched-chain amino acid transport system substrate-binding protein
MVGQGQEAARAVKRPRARPGHACWRRPRRRPADKVKVGLMLPYTGTYAALGNAIENGFKLYVAEQGGKLGGREIEYFFKVDDESDPAKATDNVNKLIKRDNVDVLVGTVHSGVALAMAKVGQGSGRC